MIEKTIHKNTLVSMYGELSKEIKGWKKALSYQRRSLIKSSKSKKPKKEIENVYSFISALAVMSLPEHIKFLEKRLCRLKQMIKNKNNKKYQLKKMNMAKITDNKKEQVNHPSHYGGESNPYETIKIIEAHKMDFVEGNVLKYLLRYKFKNGLEDLRKSKWYLERLIKNVEKSQKDAK